MMTPDQHAEAIRGLPVETRAVVTDALRVRAMDFVADRVDNDGAADLAADVCRVLMPEEARDDSNYFSPDHHARGES
jgi:hypothetical protein